MPEMFYLRTFSGLRLTSRAGEPNGEIDRPRQLALLAYLALAGDNGSSRDDILATFWPDSDTEHARGALKQLIFALRRMTGADDIILGRDRLTLNRAIVGSDVEEFSSAMAEHRFADAVALYRGPFLDGFRLGSTGQFDEWVARARERLSNDYRSALEASASVSNSVATPSPLSARTRRSVYALALTGVVGIVIMTIAVTIHRRSQAPHTLDYERELAAGLLHRGPRGRVFLESPINQTGRSDLDTLGESIEKTFRQILTSSGDAILIPRDTVRAIERAASQLPLNTAVQRLALANASINVMTVYSLANDSLRIMVYLQRVVKGRPGHIPGRTYPAGLRSSQADTLRLINETSPIARSVAPLSKPYAAILPATSQLGRELLAMRWCDSAKHSRQDSSPWCWSSENVADVVPGYFRSRTLRALEGR